MNPRGEAVGCIEAVAVTAGAWRDGAHDARADAVRRTLDAPNRFTEEALAFAVNAATHRLTAEAMKAWLGDAVRAREPRTVAVCPGAEEAPLAGLRAVLAVLLAGHGCVFRPPEASPALVPAFAEAVQQAMNTGDAFATAATTEEALARADAAIAVGALAEGGSGEQEKPQATFAGRCGAAGLPAARRYVPGAAFSAAVLDGTEDDEVLERLAEDALLYEGHGRGSVRLVWASAGTAPDAFLEAMARFRAVFPAHADTPGALRMQKAFLEARGQSHAHGDGLEFLLSRGAPDVQARGHLRWVEYDALAEVRDALAARAGALHAVAALPALAEALRPPASVPTVRPGTVHRRLLNAPGAEAVMDFVTGM